MFTFTEFVIIHYNYIIHSMLLAVSQNIIDIDRDLLLDFSRRWDNVGKL